MMLVKVNAVKKKGWEVEDNSCVQTEYVGLIKSVNILSV